MKITFTGKGYAVVMGKALFQGQSRSVPEKIARLLKAQRPDDFVITEEEAPAPAEAPPEENEEREAVSFSLTVDEIRGVAPSLNAESAKSMLAAEQAGKARVSAIKILQDRLAELESAE